MRYIKQSTSVDLPIGPFLDSADGFTAMTGLTITQPDIRLKKNGGAWAQKNAAQTLSHEENGWYEVTLDATDTATLGQLMLNVSESGALPVWHEFTVLSATVYDALIGTGDLLTAQADALLDRDMATGTDSGGRTVRNALRPLRNKISNTSGTLTVTKEDDVTSAWTAAITTDAGAVPIIGVDPT